MQNAPRRIASVATLLAAEFFAVVLLHRMGSTEWLQVDFSDLGGWLARSTAEDALAATMRLVALGIAYYLLLTTTLYVLAASSRVPGAVSAVNWITVPALRRTLEKALTVGIVTSSMVGGSAGMAMAAGGQSAAPANNRAEVISVVAAEDDLPIDDHAIGGKIAEPTTTIKDDDLPGLPSTTQAPKPDDKAPKPDAKTPTSADSGIAGFLPGLPNAAVPSSTSSTVLPGLPSSTIPANPAPTTTSTTAPAAKTTPAPLPGPSNDVTGTGTANNGTTPAALPAPNTPAGVQQTTHVVSPGENLWDIATNHLESNGRGTSESEIRDYWLQVMNANQGNLRSGDADIIYTGEAITLPAL